MENEVNPQSIPPSLPGANMDEWWYESNSEQKGSLEKEEMRNLIINGALKKNNLVWKQGWTNWLPAENTELLQYFNENMPPSLPPLNSNVKVTVDMYYEEEFRKITESNERYKGKWNWYSFLFSWPWCLYQGCWSYGLIILITLILTYGGNYYIFIGITWAIILGMRGTWLLYNVKVKKIQFPKSLF